MSYDLEASVKKLRGMIKIIHFFLDEKTFEIKRRSSSGA